MLIGVACTFYFLRHLNSDLVWSISVMCPIGTILHFSRKTATHPRGPMSGEHMVTILPKKVKKIAIFFLHFVSNCTFSCLFFIKYVKKIVFLWVLGETSSPTLRDYLTTRYDFRARLNSKIIAGRRGCGDVYQPL